MVKPGTIKGWKRTVALILFFVAGFLFLLMFFFSLNGGQSHIEGYVLNGFGLLFLGLALGLLNYGKNTLFCHKFPYLHTRWSTSFTFNFILLKIYGPSKSPPSVPNQTPLALS